MEEKTVFLVSDSNEEQQKLAFALQCAGLRVMLFNFTEHYLPYLDGKLNQVLVLDINNARGGDLDRLKPVVEAFPDLSVIVLMRQASVESAVQALRYRVFDYLIKPVTMDALVKCVQRALEFSEKAHRLGELKAVYYAVQAQEPQAALETADVVHRLAEGVSLDFNRRSIIWDAKSLHLTPTESKLLEALTEQRQRAVLHTELVMMVYGYQLDAEEAGRVLRPVVSRLRKKLEEVPGAADWIQNVRGLGYKINLHK